MQYSIHNMKTEWYFPYKAFVSLGFVFYLVVL